MKDRKKINKEEKEIEIIDNKIEKEERNSLEEIKEIEKKEIFIVGIIENLCMRNGTWEEFKIICEYLEKMKIIKEGEKIIEEMNKKEIYRKIIKKILRKNKINKEIEVISRYKKEYIEKEKIGGGGFGIVYRAENKIDGKIYAIKKIPIFKRAESEEGKKEIERILREVRIISMFNNKNIVRYYSTWIEYDEKEKYEELEEETEQIEEKERKIVRKEMIPILIIQMEICDKTLKEYIEERNKKEKEINRKETLEIIIQIVKGIKYMHEKNIVHRDLNPNNIFIKKEEGKINVKIGDFGLSKNIREQEIKKMSTEDGVEIYMSPEQKKGKYMKKSDIYSLGIICYELLNIYKTQMERIKAILELKKRKVIKKREDIIIIKMISEKIEERPSTKEIIELYKLRNNK